MLTALNIALIWKWLLDKFDLLDSTGKPQFSKLITVAILVTSIKDGTLDLWMAMLIISASFGRSTYLSFLNRATRTDTTTSTTTTAKNVTVDTARIVEAVLPGTKEPTP